MKNLAIVLFVSVGLSMNIFAQYGSEGSTDARSLGLGKTSNAISQGVYSIGINPANILKTDEVVDFSTVLPLPHISTTAGTNFITINDINYYFKGRQLSDNDKQNLNSLFNNGGLVFTNTSFTLFSFAIRLKPSIGAFGFSINDFVEGDLTIPKALSTLALYGNPQNSTYNFDDTKFNSWWIRNYSLSYAREINGISSPFLNKLTAGISLKLYQGFAYAQSTLVSGNSIQTGTNNAVTLNTNYTIQSAFSDNFHVKYSYDSLDTAGKGSFSPFPSPAGSGFGFDIGFSANIFNNWDVALAITDIGSITWNKHTAITTSSSQYTLNDLFNKDQQDSIKDKFKGTSAPAGSFSTDLPTTLRFGAAHMFKFGDGFPGTLLVALDVNQGFNSEPGNSTKTRVSIGGEWEAAHGVPVLRTGVSFGGLLGFHWGLGLGINAGFLEFNFATLDMQSLIATNSAKYLSVALDTRWKF